MLTVLPMIRRLYITVFDVIQSIVHKDDYNI